MKQCSVMLVFLRIRRMLAAVLFSTIGLFGNPASSFSHGENINQSTTASILHDWWLQWVWDPALLVLIPITVLYLLGLKDITKRTNRQTQPKQKSFPLWRAAAFITGMSAMLLALVSPIDVMADFSFSAHMLQHMLLTLVGAPLVILGSPFLLVLRGVPYSLRKRLLIPLLQKSWVQKPLRIIVQPLPAFAFFQLTTILWHIPFFYDSALFITWAHYLQHSLFTLGAILFWWNVITQYPFTTRLNTFAAMAYVFMSTVVNSSLSAILAFAEVPLYGYQNLPALLGGISPLTDQQLGASLMWTMGTMLHLAIISGLFAVLTNQANQEEQRLRLSTQ